MDVGGLVLMKMIAVNEEGECNWLSTEEREIRTHYWKTSEYLGKGFNIWKICKNFFLS